MCAGVCLMDRCVCVQECPFDLFGWVFLVHVVMYWFVLHTWHWDLHGYSSVLGFGQVVSPYPGSCFLYSMKVMALFPNSKPVLFCLTWLQGGGGGGSFQISFILT